MDWLVLNETTYLGFFAVLLRMSTAIVLLPILGDRVVPAPVKILLSVILSFMVYSVLVTSGQLKPEHVHAWSHSASTLMTTMILECAFGLVIGFVARLVFDAVQIGGDLIGNFMGLASASQYDPHQDSQTQIIAKFYMTVAMLLFVVVDGHHLLIQALAHSYDYVSMGKVTLTGSLGEALIDKTGGILRVGLQMGAPMAVCFFAINIVYGIIAKSTPQINILVLSFSISAMVGMFVMWASFPEFIHLSQQLMDGVSEDLVMFMRIMGN